MSEIRPEKYGIIKSAGWRGKQRKFTVVLEYPLGPPASDQIVPNDIWGRVPVKIVRCPPLERDER